MDILQKVAKSSCVNKANYIISKMMATRQKKASNAIKPIIGKVGRERSFNFEELDEQETEFYLLSQVNLTYIKCPKNLRCL